MLFIRFLLASSVPIFLLIPALVWGDVACDATLTTLDEAGSEQVIDFRVYVKSNKVKLERNETSDSFILRTDLQMMLNVFPAESAYAETGFSQFYVIPFGPNPLVISPGFTRPTVELILTNETAVINAITCRKYIIQEISPFRMLQYTIFATEELAFAESFASFFQSESPLDYQPFEEMRKIPGLPLTIVIFENANGRSYTSTYHFYNYVEVSLEEGIFAAPLGYNLK